MWERLMEKDILFRFLYVILIGGLAFLFPVGKVKDENKKWVYTSMTLVTASMLSDSAGYQRGITYLYFPFYS